MATVDAIHHPRNSIYPPTAVNEAVLKRLETDMDLFERVSCLFLIIQDYKLGYNTFMTYARDPSTMISKFVIENEVIEWRYKIVEAICLVQNDKILRKLGNSLDDARTFFGTNISDLAHKVNKYAKAMFHLIDNMSSGDATKLLDRVYQEISPPVVDAWPDENSLEIHVLWWIHRGFVEILGDKWNLNNVLRVLKALGLSGTDAYDTLKKYDSETNDTCRYDDRSNSERSALTGEREDGVVQQTPRDTRNKYVIKSGLAIVFNHTRFPPSMTYEYRHGSNFDCERIKETFVNTFGFEVVVHDNFRRQEIYDELDCLRNAGGKFDCVVVFVLSHGTRGNVIASDGFESPIDTIREKICCDALLGMPKVLVIQACQTQALTTDNSVMSRVNDVARHRDFLMLSSTISGELSVRDPKQGTWYIQILCEVLEEKCEQGWSVYDCATEVQSRFSDMKAVIDGKVIGQVPKLESTLVKKLFFPKRANR